MQCRQIYPYAGAGNSLLYDLLWFCYIFFTCTSFLSVFFKKKIEFFWKMESVREATGVDMQEIIKVSTYDTQENPGRFAPKYLVVASLTGCVDVNSERI